MPRETIRIWWRLIVYETRILRRETVSFVFGGLLFVTLILLLSPHSSTKQTVWIFFENLVPLVLLFIPIGLISNDCEQSLIERIFSITEPGILIYSRRLLLITGIDTLAILFLALLWQWDVTTPPLGSILITSLPPVLFLTGLSFAGAVWVNDANGGATIGGSWWILNLILKRYGDSGWFSYIYLFKQTYYPDAASFGLNRIALVALAFILTCVGVIGLRRPERYL